MRFSKPLTAAVAVGVAATVTTVGRPDVALAANSISNIPLNVLQTLYNLPANELAGIQATSDAMKESGNWWLYTPTNVIGFDQADKAKIDGITKLLIPVPKLAASVAAPLNTIAEAEFPMTANCTGIPGPCASATYWTPYFNVAPWTLLSGYKFGDVENTIDPTIPIPWSNTTGQVNPLGPVGAIWDTLTQDPTGFKDVPGVGDYAKALLDMGVNSFNSLNPFVDGTYCLPCQIVSPGAPDSLTRIPLFGNWYTFADLGQQFTDTDRPGHPDPTAPDGNVDALSLWSPEGQARLWQDIQKSATDPSYSQKQIDQALDFVKTEAGIYGPWITGAPAGILGAIGAVGQNAGSLGTDVIGSILEPFGASAGSAATASPATSGASSAASKAASVVSGPTYSSTGDGYTLTPVGSAAKAATQAASAGSTTAAESAGAGSIATTGSAGTDSAGTGSESAATSGSGSTGTSGSGTSGSGASTNSGDSGAKNVVGEAAGGAAKAAEGAAGAVAGAAGKVADAAGAGASGSDSKSSGSDSKSSDSGSTDAKSSDSSSSDAKSSGSESKSSDSGSSDSKSSDPGSSDSKSSGSSGSGSAGSSN
ncbi:hypothetical protein P0W64_08685 [Tsukamurella sp. 8F]|uniref:hypothetical protein n=1 Tax=unclassified Tsukamurella TaxID=2633480 RepID=UPI0023BA1E71|nr:MULTISPECIES: hypothetical protein [unclassified Tsukamurella]MDF0530505.1 hypothetical protein [Tsukamurella sp. 8J]MDF0586845.1 hypothetical protein [Tsukamurella sp. 8F]